MYLWHQHQKIIFQFISAAEEQEGGELFQVVLLSKIRTIVERTTWPSSRMSRVLKAAFHHARNWAQGGDSIDILGGPKTCAMFGV